MSSMFEDNPNLIQDPPPPPQNTSPWLPHKTPTPLVLIHDGGGTIFSYYCLGDLGRAVYGISNPNYPSGKAWKGGIPEMARHYLGFIKTALPKGGDLIIGGWSLGGLISLEVARQLAEENASANAKADNHDNGKKTLNLLGIVMVDSVCPLELTAPPLPVVQHVAQWSEHTKQETRDRVMRCYSEATRMLGEWKLPVWDDDDDKDNTDNHPDNSSNNNNTTNPQQQHQQQNGTVKGNSNGHATTLTQVARNLPKPRPPPVILLRAREPVPVPVPGEGISKADIHRGDRLLGWASYRADLITSVIDIPGHHFSIFRSEETLATTTAAIRKACLDLEDLHARGVGTGMGVGVGEFE